MGMTTRAEIRAAYRRATGNELPDESIEPLPAPSLAATLIPGLAVSAFVVIVIFLLTLI